VAIQRQTSAQPTTPTFRVGINITLTGSKKMTQQQQEALMEGLDGVRIIIVHQDADITLAPDTPVLVNTIAPPKEFKTGSVGFGLQAVGVEFSGSPE
jgi:hypothetical protein